MPFENSSTLSVVTWNTQGRPDQGEKKQTLDALLLNHDVVLLQECGALAQEDAYSFRNVIEGTDVTANVFGRLTPGDRNIRCSTAILSCHSIDNPEAFDLTNTRRLGLSAQIKGIVVGTLHATSGGVGKADVRIFLATLSGAYPGAPIIVGGDFNYIPEPTLEHRARLGAHAGRGEEMGADKTWTTNAGTRSRDISFTGVQDTGGRASHPSSNSVLDFFFCKNIHGGQARLGHNGGSDHRYVSCSFG